MRPSQSLACIAHNFSSFRRLLRPPRVPPRGHEEERQGPLHLRARGSKEGEHQGALPGRRMPQPLIRQAGGLPHPANILRARLQRDVPDGGLPTLRGDPWPLRSAGPEPSPGRT